MNDERDWDHDFKKAREAYKKTKIKDDKKIVREWARNIVIEKNNSGEKWTVSFLTQFGIGEVVYFPENGKWNSKKGKAKGKGAMKMLRYFKPMRREVDGNK